MLETQKNGEWRNGSDGLWLNGKWGSKGMKNSPMGIYSQGF